MCCGLTKILRNPKIGQNSQLSKSTIMLKQVLNFQIILKGLTKQIVLQSSMSLYFSFFSVTIRGPLHTTLRLTPYPQARTIYPKANELSTSQHTIHSYCYGVSSCYVTFAWVTQSEPPKGAKNGIKRPKGLQLEVGVRRAPRHLVDLVFLYIQCMYY